MPPYCIATVSSIALLQCLRSERLVQLGRRRQLLRPTFTPHLLSDSERKTTPVAVKKKTRGKKKENRWLWLDARRARRPNLYSTSTTARQQIQTRHLTDRC